MDVVSVHLCTWLAHIQESMASTAMIDPDAPLAKIGHDQICLIRNTKIHPDSPWPVFPSADDQFRHLIRADTLDILLTGCFVPYKWHFPEKHGRLAVYASIGLDLCCIIRSK